MIVLRNVLVAVMKLYTDIQKVVSESKAFVWFPLWNNTDHSCVYMLVIHPLALAIFFQMTVLNLSPWPLLILYSQKKHRVSAMFSFAAFHHSPQSTLSFDPLLDTAC